MFCCWLLDHIYDNILCFSQCPMCISLAEVLFNYFFVFMVLKFLNAFIHLYTGPNTIYIIPLIALYTDTDYICRDLELATEEVGLQIY